MPLFTRHLSRWQADLQREEIADIYVKCYDEPPGLEFPNRQAFLARFADDVKRPGFDLVAAEEHALIGCCYGYAVSRDGAWWSGLRGGVPDRIEEATAAGEVFAIGELMVLPRQRRRGVGSRLVADLLNDCAATLAVVQLDPADETARAAYLGWGWRKLGDVAAHAAAPMREVWIRTLTG